MANMDYLPSVFSTGQTPGDIVQISKLNRLLNPDGEPLDPPPVLRDRRYVPENFRGAFVTIYVIVLAGVLGFAYARPLVRCTRTALSRAAGSASKKRFFVADDLLLFLSVIFFIVYTGIGIYGTISLQWGFRGGDWTLKSIEISHKIFFTSSLLSIASLTFIRLDLLLFCRRTNKRVDARINGICCLILAALTIAYFFGATLAEVLFCGPSNIKAAFDVWQFAKAHCDSRAISLGVSAADAFLNVLVCAEIIMTIMADRAQREIGDATPTTMNRPSRIMCALCILGAFGSIGNVYLANSRSLTFTFQVYYHLINDLVCAFFTMAAALHVLRRPGMSDRVRRLHASFVSQDAYSISDQLSTPISSVAPRRPVRTLSVEMDGKSIRSFAAFEKAGGLRRTPTDEFEFDLDKLSLKDIEVASAVFIKNMD